MPQAEEAGDLDLLAEALEQAAEFSMVAGEFESSRRYREREIEIRERVGNLFEAAFQSTNLALLDYYVGDWSSARDLAERGLAGGRAIDNLFVVRAALDALGELAMAQGDWDRAQQVLDEAASNSVGSVQIGRFIQRDLAELDILRGRPRHAIDRLQPIVSAAETEDNDIVSVLPNLAWAMLEAGEVQAASEIAGRAVDLATAWDNALALVDARRVHGMVLRELHRTQEAAEAFQAGVALAQKMPYRYAEARALCEWGIMDLPSSPHDARDRLQQASVIFRKLGAARDVARIDGLLAGQATA
jgi:tetratricopeptide (TPR) repeat protein